MLKLKSELTLPSVGLTGFEAPLTEEENAIQGSSREYPIEKLLHDARAAQIEDGEN